MDEDTQATLEWAEWKASLCPGCQQPKHESFSLATDDRYRVEVLECHACAARDRKAYNRNAYRDKDVPPSFGEYYAVMPED